MYVSNLFHKNSIYNTLNKKRTDETNTFWNIWQLVTTHLKCDRCLTSHRNNLFEGWMCLPSIQHVDNCSPHESQPLQFSAQGNSGLCTERWMLKEAQTWNFEDPQTWAWPASITVQSGICLEYNKCINRCKKAAQQWFNVRAMTKPLANR